jgi:hypothetical protein
MISRRPEFIGVGHESDLAIIRWKMVEHGIPFCSQFANSLVVPLIVKEQIVVTSSLKLLVTIISNNAFLVSRK